MFDISWAFNRVHTQIIIWFCFCITLKSLSLLPCPLDYLGINFTEVHPQFLSYATNTRNTRKQTNMTSHTMVISLTREFTSLPLSKVTV